MAELYLLRHGQASFGAMNYDELSELGERQALAAGQYLRQVIKPDRLVMGSLKRHQQTMEQCLMGLEHDLVGNLDVQVMEELNEFDHVEILHRYRPQWQQREVMVEELKQLDNPREVFQRHFIEAIKRWLSGGHDSDYSETWQQFQQRVMSGLDTLCNHDEYRQTMVVTSGGPISVITQALLNLGNREAFAINNVLANASLTKVLYSQQRRSLAYLNNYAYLELAGADWVSFR